MGSSKISYAGSPSVTQKNRVNPTAKVGKGKAPLEAVGPNASGVKAKASPKNMSYTDGGNITTKGYPRGTFKGVFPANKPIKYGKGKVQMGSQS
jgi:hypothetical protein